MGYFRLGFTRWKKCWREWICVESEGITVIVWANMGKEVMEWMLDIQLGRRNLSPIQRIAIAEKYRSIYEKQAKENQGARNDLKNNIPQNLGESEKKKISKNREVNSRLAKVANVNPETYRQAKRVLDSNDEDLKQRVLSGETSINAGYKELTQNKKGETIIYSPLYAS